MYAPRRHQRGGHQRRDACDRAAQRLAEQIRGRGDTTISASGIDQTRRTLCRYQNVWD